MAKKKKKSFNKHDFFKNKTSKRKHKMAVQAESETSFKQYKNTLNRRSERIGKLTKHTKSSTIQTFGKNKETKQKKMLKNTGRPNKRILTGEDMASFNEARIQNSTPKNTAITKRVMRRHRVS